MKDKILELRAQGLTYNEIKNELGCSKGTISYHLGPGQKEKSYKRNRSKTNMRRRHLNKIKTESACMDCGENYPHFVMDLDHRPGTLKKFNVSNLNLFSSMEEFLDEIAKCDIVCANCHRLRTWTRQSESPHPRTHEK